jgi:hypothetical protein
MAMGTGPTDDQGIGGEIAGGDRETSGIDRAEEARVGDVGSPHPVDQPETAAEPDPGTETDLALGGGAPSGEAPNTGGMSPGDGPERTPGD